MVIKVDATFFERARRVQDDKACAALKAVLADSDGFRAMSPTDRAAAASYIDTVWAEASMLDFNYPVSLQKYVLILLTQSRWRSDVRAGPLYWAYARRMIGSPDQNWRLESGVAAVYRNVVAQHFLTDAVKAFIAA